MYDTIIFDIDGTIADTSEGVIEAVKYTLKSSHLKELNEDELKNFASYSPLKQGFIHFCNVDDETANSCCNIYREYYRDKTMILSRLYNGIILLLDILKEKNYKIGIATFKNEENAKLLLKELKINDYFDYIAGASYEKSQTKTDILKKCLKELKSDSKKAIFTGDSPSDANASIEAGCAFIGVTYGFGFKSNKEIINFNPLIIADSIKDIIEFVNQM